MCAILRKIRAQMRRGGGEETELVGFCRLIWRNVAAVAGNSDGGSGSSSTLVFVNFLS